MSKRTVFDVKLASRGTEIENVTEFGIEPIRLPTEQPPAALNIKAAAYSYADMFHLVAAGSIVLNSTNYAFVYPALTHLTISACISASWVFGAEAVVEPG